MLVGIFSDTHLGYGQKELYEESFERFREAIKILKEKKVEVILHAGDLFDEAVPSQEVWAETFEIFEENSGEEETLVKEKLGEEKKVTVRGTPIIAIHGTHEFRGKDFANALDVLESACCLVHLHAAKTVIEKNGEKLAVHGLSGVPERNVKKVLEKYSPKPVSGATNILLLHQAFKEFLPFGDEAIASLSMSDLPGGFDLIVDGHLHWGGEQEVEGKRILITGSTLFTQMKKLEGEREKGVFLFDTKTKTIDFVPFKNQRKLFYEKIEFKEGKPEEVKKTVEEKVSQILSQNFELKPLVRLKLVGTLAKGFAQSDISFELPDKAIFSVSKDFSSEKFMKKIESFKEAHMKKKSVVELGIDLLEKNVEEARLKDFDTRRLFELLAEGEIEKAEKALLE
jgi:DNA repair exonuclease SbcCD nuclease subunit